MRPLSEELQSPKESLAEFKDVTLRVLDYLPNVISRRIDERGYILFSSEVAGTVKHVRPIRESLFISEKDLFSERYDDFILLMGRLKAGDRNLDDHHYQIIDSVTYTLQQSMGVGLDLLVNPNSARKHVGNRFEELLRLLFSELGIANGKIVFKIPYEGDEGEKYYRCETDLILSPHPEVGSTSGSLHPQEIVVSAKTSSKDRMGKIFLDKLLMQRFADREVKVIGIFLNDVQRKGEEKISFTLVSGLFLVYTKFLTRLDGVYFVDPPPGTACPPLSEHIKPLSRLIVDDVRDLLG